MLGAVIDVLAAVLATAIVMVVPGAALCALLRLDRFVPPLLRPAAAVGGTVAVASIALVATLAMQRSLQTMAVILVVVTVACALGALLRWSPDRARRVARSERLRSALPFAAPSLMLVVLAIFDSPHVRSDTYWHVALARKLETFDQLSSKTLAFEAGAPGNPNYPLPTWHALVALADAAPRVDLWSATWFMTLWLAPVAMLAFGGMAATFVGDRRAGLAGCWTFVAVVVLGYGPWFFATRYLSYAGQIAIYLLLPLALTALVSASAARGRARAGPILVASTATALIGVLHANYVLYPALFAGGGAVLLLLGARERWRPALLAAVAVSCAGAATLAAQLPWITKDDNFLRGGNDPSGEPTAFIRHRDVFTGSEDSHHVVLGSLATQPLLVLGALLIPLLLLVARRRLGPWHLAGGAAAIVAFARSPQAIDFIDRLGTVTPATRFDRVYPAAVGVLAAALAIGWVLARAWRRGPVLGGAATMVVLGAVGASAWWADAIRDIRRIVVTPFVEARWVGGLRPDGVPRAAVLVATVGIIAAAVWIRFRDRDRAAASEADAGTTHAAEPRDRYVLATLVVVAVVVGLAPASIERASVTWQPEAYRRSLRTDRDVTRIEVYPPAGRRVIRGLEPGSTVLAAFDDTRRIASLAPVYSIEESVLRDISADPPEPGAAAAARLAELVQDWNADYVAGSTGYGASNASFRAMLDAAAADPERYQPIATGALRMFRVRDRDGDAG